MPNFKPRDRGDEGENIWMVQTPIDTDWGIYARQSTQAQVKRNVQSTEMQTDDLIAWLLERGVKDSRIALFDADLGVSGTKRIDERTGLQELVERIKMGLIKAVLVYQISRLFRDETGVQYNVFADICRKNNCILCTADGMIFNFRNPMHLKMFRFLAEIAAEYIPQHIYLLHQAREKKSRKGLYAGLGGIPRGYIVDYDEKSKTYEKYIQYTSHSGIILELFEQFYGFDGDLIRMCRELDTRPYVFPYFDEDLDPRNKPRRQTNGNGGYHLSRGGLISILTNPVYIGWWIVCGDVVSRDNHERIIDREHEYLFWFAFDRLSDYTVDGEENQERTTRRVRYSQKKITKPEGLLKDRIAGPNGEDIYTHTMGSQGKACYVTKNSTASYMRFVHGEEVPVSLIDTEFSQILFGHLRKSHEFDNYRQFVNKHEERRSSAADDLESQMREIVHKQEEITDEILSIRHDIATQIAERMREDPELDPAVIKQSLETEHAPILRDLRKRSAKLEETRGPIERKLEGERKGKYQRPKLPQAVKYEDFQTELERLVQIWDKIPIQDRKDFVNLLLETAILHFVAPHWVRLDLYWAIPGWEGDTLYIHRKYGTAPDWTDEEKGILREHYPARRKTEILQMLPLRSWKAIIHMAIHLGISRVHSTKSQNCPVPMDATYRDFEFTESMGLEPSARNTIRINLSTRINTVGDWSRAAIRLRFLLDRLAQTETA